ncbi:hydrolase, had superfamily, cof family [Companilactobacillus kimchiensis]|uniref:Hydrolase, had superfamily, cof family n=2 Tax=Companilactobacillus kimchiensis TaxID=993692 RepID=A0A0R2LE36_9LACO|nr:hydrolase, had superfamily, cof family [Companilactobacillus kimchiensis]
MDVDGTLMLNHQNISQHTKDTIEKLQKKDIKFYIATGRMYELAMVAKNMLNHDVGLVTSNGAVFDGVNGREVTKLGNAAVELAYKVTQEAELPMMLFTPEKAYFTKKIPDFIARNAGNFDESFGYKEIENLAELIKIEDQITNGVILSRGNLSELVATREKLLASKLLRISSSSPDNLEMIPLNTDKGTAVKQLQLEQHVDPSHTFVFGDGLNDTGMMQEAELSVAMGNALPEVKKIANYETDTNINDGLAKFLERYFQKHPLA